MTSTTYAERRALSVAPSLRRDLALAARQIGYDQRAFWRNRMRAFFSFLFPVIFLVVFASLNRKGTLDSRGGLPYDVFFVPGILAYGVVLATFGSLAVAIAAMRDNGVLKRVRGTPLPMWGFLAGQVGSAIVTAAAMAVLMLGLGRAAYGVHVRLETLPGLLLALALGTACFAALGIGVQRIVRNAETAPIVANVLILPLSFVSGIWYPADDLPGWLSSLAGFFPLKPLADALQVAFDPATAGPGIVWHDLLALAAWTAVGILMSIRFLRAEQRRA
jgi:ABC-2 type transport system permease protein